MEIALIIACCIVFSAVMVSIAHPVLVKIAVYKSIVDNPNVRKLNKKPVPVLGGVGVFYGIFMTIALLCFRYDCSPLFILVMAMLIMLFTGVADDILNLSANKKFILQIMAVALLMANGYVINDLNGLLGIYTLPNYLSYPLTLVAGLGVINAINLIDGVDGLSSGYGMIVATICGIFFTIHGNAPFLMLSWTIVGALFPFFVQNVFGRKFKMFIGDGGSLMLGIIFFAFIVRILQSYDGGVGSPYLVTLTLAIFAVPVFDTLRVMTARIFGRRSPFSPDKTHLHHMFIKLGYSHAMTTLLIICLNLLAVAMWVITALIIPINPSFQLFIILLSCMAVTWGVWYSVNYIEKHRPELYERLQAKIRMPKAKRAKLFLKIQNMLG